MTIEIHRDVDEDSQDTSAWAYTKGISAYAIST